MSANKIISLVIATAVSLLLASTVASARETLVSNQQEFKQAVKKLQPGDTVVMANGTWQDFEMVFQGQGTAEQPITLTAQEPGKVQISGKSNLRLAGEYLVVSGLLFKNGYTPTDSVISFRKSKSELANHSRVTNTVIDNFNNPERFETDYWVALYGKHNRFDHNHLEGKRNKGVTMAVRLDSEDSLENHHRIDHNYFGPRPMLGSNGGETLRIGTSHYSLSDSFTLVENNYFDRCDGEVEIISNKSGSNTFRGNVFYESRGTLTLRHGNGNMVENNVFFGNNVDHTGGIRVINKRQTIRNNYLEGLTGYRFGGALVVMNGVPNSPINRYHQVEDAVIENNSWINSDHIQLAAGSDAERTATPVNSQFKRNLVYNETGKDIFTLYDDVSGISFSGNVLNQVKGPQLATGFASEKVKLRRAANGLLYPVDKDLAGVGVSADLSPIEKKATGASWYPKIDKRIRFETGKTIAVKPQAGALEQAVSDAQAGDTLKLAPGQYLVSKILTIDKPLTVSGGKGVQIKFERSTLFEIVDGGSLHLRGLAISGADAPDNVGNSVIRTSRYSMLVNYQVKIENCDITDLDVNKSFNFLSVAKGTMADDITIANSRFSNISGVVLQLDRETDDFGIYNAEYLRISDSSFSDVQGALVDYYRGGTDESTFGPHFYLTGSTLDKVGSKSQHKASMYLHGVQVANIANNTFKHSAPIRVAHTVGEPITKIVKNDFAATPAPVVAELNSSQENTAIILDNQITMTQQ
ncbi:MAG: alginate lyase [Gammaproteobacteria bacterium]|nr:alginate lyase [Gammaproteobacteria bacterium]